MSIDASQLAQYRRDGFLVLPRFIDSQTLAILRTAYDAIIERQVEAGGDRMLGGLTRQVMFPSWSHPVFDRNPAVESGIRIARVLLATDDVHRSFDMLIYKPPAHPHPTPWHQDMSYSGHPVAAPGLPIPLESIQFWVALDDVDEETGCMCFVPGYQCRPLLRHHIAAGDPSDDSRLLEIVDPADQLDLSTAVAAPLAAGDATVHSYGTPHYTGPNRSTTRARRAYIFNVATATAMLQLFGQPTV